MKNYQKAEMIAKNLPTGSYAAGCPADQHKGPDIIATRRNGYYESWGATPLGCQKCEVAQ